MQIVQLLRQEQQSPIQPPLHGLGRDAQDSGGLVMGQSLDPDQAEDFPLLFRQVFDGLQDAAAVRAQLGDAALRRRHHALVQLDHGRLFVQAAGQVIELPAHVLVGQREEFAHGPRTGLTHGLE